MTRSGIRTMLLAGTMLVTASAAAVDWNGVEGTQIILFYPGQSSWERTLTPSDHEGAEKFRSGKDCLECHEDEEVDMGNTLVSGEKLEPDPVAGKPGSLPVEIKAAYDQERLYLQLSWKDTGFKAPEPESENLLHVAMMLDDGKVASFDRGGCWATCHADVTGMPSASGDMTKYLAKSRTKVTRTGGGTNYKSDGDLQSLMQEGSFLEYWLATVADAGSPAVAGGGYILKERHESDAPGVGANASFEGEQWTVELSRPLKAAGTGQKSLAEGNTYTVGFAVHDGYADGRRHYVSFKRTLTLGGGDGQLIAKKQ